MIKTYVLIVVLVGSGGGSSSGGKAAITQEFNSLEQCQYVWNTIKDQLKDDYYTTVRGGGCFLK